MRPERPHDLGVRRRRSHAPSRLRRPAPRRGLRWEARRDTDGASPGWRRRSCAPDCASGRCRRAAASQRPRSDDRDSHGAGRAGARRRIVGGRQWIPCATGRRASPDGARAGGDGICSRERLLQERSGLRPVPAAEGRRASMPDPPRRGLAPARARRWARGQIFHGAIAFAPIAAERRTTGEAGDAAPRTSPAWRPRLPEAGRSVGRPVARRQRPVFEPLASREGIGRNREARGRGQGRKTGARRERCVGEGSADRGGASRAARDGVPIVGQVAGMWATRPRTTIHRHLPHTPELLMRPVLRHLRRAQRHSSGRPGQDGRRDVRPAPHEE